ILSRGARLQQDVAARGGSIVTLARAFLACGAFALALVAAGADAEDVEVGEQAGQAIGRLADAVRDFRLTSLPSDLHVQARTMEFDFRQGQLLYKGAVAVQHGDVSMRPTSSRSPSNRRIRARCRKSRH